MTTFAIITLVILLLVAINVALFYHKRADIILRKSRSQQMENYAYRDANRDPNAIYCVQRVETDLPEYRQYNNCWGVCRRTTNRGFMFCTTIKVFTDEDDDFNLREAEELCEVLNSK